jgi:hypothetical protein
LLKRTFTGVFGVFDSKKNIENQTSLSNDMNKIHDTSYEYINNVIFLFCIFVLFGQFDFSPLIPKKDSFDQFRIKLDNTLRDIIKKDEPGKRLKGITLNFIITYYL